MTLDSPQCVEAFRFYGDLIRTSSVKGAQDVDTTRATYFAGKAAMVDLVTVHPRRAGRAAQRRPADLPAVPGGPGVPREEQRVRHRDQGPERHRTGPVRRDQLVGGTRRRGTDPAKSFVEYMLGDGYPRWFGMSPEGRFPVRKGTPAEPEAT